MCCFCSHSRKVWNRQKCFRSPQNLQWNVFCLVLIRSVCPKSIQFSLRLVSVIAPSRWSLCMQRNRALCVQQDSHSAQKVTLAAQIWVKFLSSHNFETQKVAQRDIMGQIPIPAFSKPSAQVIDQQIHKWVSWHFWTEHQVIFSSYLKTWTEN